MVSLAKMTLLDAVDAGPIALKEFRSVQFPEGRELIRRELQKLQRAGVIYWVKSLSADGYRVLGHWARCKNVDSR